MSDSRQKQRFHLKFDTDWNADHDVVLISYILATCCFGTSRFVPKQVALGRGVPLDKLQYASLVSRGNGQRERIGGGGWGSGFFMWKGRGRNSVLEKKLKITDTLALCSLLFIFEFVLAK